MSASSPIDDPDFGPLAASEKITVDEYRRQAALGKFGIEKGVELLEGKIVPKARQTLRHEGALEKIEEVLGKMLPEGWHLRIAQPLLAIDSLPEPDVAVASDTLDEDPTALPRQNQVPLVIEVAEGSLAADRRLKGRVYARAGILNYWVLNLIDRQLEVFTTPSGPVAMPGYHEQRIYRAEEKISLVIGLDDLGTVRVADIIP
jgi:Putative restriction endonuclease